MNRLIPPVRSTETFTLKTGTVLKLTVDVITLGWLEHQNIVARHAGALQEMPIEDRERLVEALTPPVFLPDTPEAEVSAALKTRRETMESLTRKYSKEILGLMTMTTQYMKAAVVRLAVQPGAFPEIVAETEADIQALMMQVPEVCMQWIGARFKEANAALLESKEKKTKGC